MKISAVILTKNEEKNIERCINSVLFCDEIIVVDDYSTDDTINIVHQVLKVHKVYKVYKVYKRELSGDFAGQRNFAMEKAKGDWILFIDADEIVTNDLINKIQGLIQRNFKFQISNFKSILNDQNLNLKCQAFSIKRRDFFMGREMKYGETKKVREKGIVRLVKKGSGTWLGNVHEVFHTAKNIGELNGFLDHYPHPTINDFINDINQYSSLRAKELFDHGNKTNILEIIFYPLFKFILTYFIRLGFLDGAQGFIYSFFMSFHSFLVRTKLYQYTEKRG